MHIRSLLCAKLAAEILSQTNIYAKKYLRRMRQPSVNDFCINTLLSKKQQYCISKKENADNLIHICKKCVKQQLNLCIRCQQYIQAMIEKSISQLCRSIQLCPPQRVYIQTLHDTSSRLYLAIKTMYQQYKKSHQLQIMQDHVFSFNMPTEVQKYVSEPVRAKNLFSYHSFQEEDIMLMIRMKDHLSQEHGKEIYSQLLIAIGSLKKIGSMMKCYRQLLNIAFLNGDMQKYRQVQNSMIEALMRRKIVGKQFTVLAKHILALPIIKFSILQLISRLYQKIEELKDFSLLYKIFISNFPEKPSQEQLQALIRICLPETLIHFMNIVSEGGQMVQRVISIAQKEAICKLSCVSTLMTAKTKAILQFVVYVVKVGCPIWLQIIEWEHVATQEPKTFLKEQLEDILVMMLNNSDYLQPLLPILQKITQIDQHSQIALIFVRELLRLDNRQFVSHFIVRKFLAYKVMRYATSQNYARQLFSKVNFIQIVLQLFDFEGVSLFFEHFLRAEPGVCQAFVRQVKDKMPVKYKELAIRVLLMEKEVPGLTKCLMDTLSFEFAVSITREMLARPFNKQSLMLLDRLLRAYREHKQISVLRNLAARSLNAYLVVAAKEEISLFFKINLPTIIKEHLLQQSKLIFEGVPAQTTQNLKKTFDQIMIRKKI